MTYEHRLKVRYAETDQMGVVHHANYLLYFEEARTEYMAELGCPYGEVERDGVGLAVRAATLRYRAPARYEDELAVEVRISRMRAASLSFDYSMRRPADGALVATGQVELACIDLAKATPRPLPERLRAVLEAATR